MTYIGFIETPVGWMYLVANESGLEKAIFETSQTKKSVVNIEPKFNQNQNEINIVKNEIIHMAEWEISEYFSGRLTKFSTPINQSGTNFQKEVWGECLKIQSGTYKTYSELAEHFGGIKYARAVGAALGKNQVLIFIPCHRVVGKNNSLIDYVSGVKVKEFLLYHEKAISSSDVQAELFHTN